MIFVMVIMTGVGVIPVSDSTLFRDCLERLDRTAQHHGSDDNDQGIAAKADGAVVGGCLPGGLPHGRNPSPARR